MPPQNLVRRAQNIRVAVYRIYDLDVVARRQPAQRPHGGFEPRAETLPAMAGDDDQLAQRIQTVDAPGGRPARLQPVANIQDGVDTRISGDEHVAWRHAFRMQSFGGSNR